MFFSKGMAERYVVPVDLFIFLRFARITVLFVLSQPMELA